MLNRITIASCVKYLFDNLDNFNPKDCYEYIKSHNDDLPDNTTKVLEELYYKILLNNKELDLDTQINVASINYDTLRNYLKDNGLLDRNIETRLSLMDIEIPIMNKFLKSRESVRKIRKGYK